MMQSLHTTTPQAFFFYFFLLLTLFILFKINYNLTCQGSAGFWQSYNGSIFQVMMIYWFTLVFVMFTSSDFFF